MEDLSNGVPMTPKVAIDSVSYASFEALPSTETQN